MKRTEKTSFNVVIPVYNVESLCPTTILNALALDYSNYRITLVDDASTDATPEICEAFKALAPERITVLHSKENRGPTNSVRLGCACTNEDEVVVQIDGDGDFIRKDVLRHYDVFFRNPDIWMCGGMVEKFSMRKGSEDYRMHISKSFTRKDGVCHFHPRAWRSWLYWKVPAWHLFNPETGEYWRHGSDCSFLWPMWELAGKDRIGFLEFPAYWHNHDNPLNTWKTQWVRRERDDYFSFIQGLRPFERLKTPDSPVRRVSRPGPFTEFDDGTCVLINAPLNRAQDNRLRRWKKAVERKVGEDYELQHRRGL